LFDTFCTLADSELALGFLHVNTYRIYQNLKNVVLKLSKKGC